MPLKPLYKGQVGSVRGPDRARRHSPRRVVRYPLAVLKQALEDQLTQVNKGLENAKADVPEFTALLDAGKDDLAKAEKSLAALVSSQASVKGLVVDTFTKFTGLQN